MRRKYCDCCGTDYEAGEPACECSYRPKCPRCKACITHCREDGWCGSEAQRLQIEDYQARLAGRMNAAEIAGGTVAAP